MHSSRFFITGRPIILVLISFFHQFVHADLTAQCAIAFTGLRTGLATATVPAGLMCPGTSTYINWGDGCTNPGVVAGGTTLHQYQTCGTYTVTVGCLGGATVCSTTLPSLSLPSLIITNSQTIIPGSCGNEIELTFHISNDDGCDTSFNAPVTITGTIPGTFDITGGNITYSGHTLSFTIPANTLPNKPAYNTYTLKIKPVYCAPNNQQALILTVSVPDGYGLGYMAADCSQIIPPPAGPLPNNPRNYNFFVTPQVPCLKLDKTTSTPYISPGGTAIYQVSITNSGNLPANNVQVHDYLPTGLTLVSSPPATTVIGSVATTTISSIAGGATQVLTYTFTHTGTMCDSGGDYENCADAYLPDCNVSTDLSCAHVQVGMAGVTMLHVTGSMGTLAGGAWPVPAGLPPSGSSTPLVIDFDAGSILHINSSSYIFPVNTLFRMREGASITVDAGKALQISTGSHLFSCDNLWKGIRLENGSRFLMYRSILEDAAYGVDIVGNLTALVLNGNIFQNNFTGVRALALGTGHNISAHYLQSNTFQSVAALKPPYSGAPVYGSGAFGFAGMDLADMKNLLLIGGAGGTNTLFRGLCYGVRARETSLNFTNTQWADINALYIYPGELPTGVSSTASASVQSLTIQGLGYTSSAANTSFNCQLGTYADNINLILRNSKQDAMVIGIYQKNGSNRSTEIDRNTINCALIGILCQSNSVQTIFDVKVNIVTFQNAYPWSITAGISIEKFVGVNNCFVRNNEISTNGARYGLHFSDVNGLQSINGISSYLQVAANKVTMLQQNTQAHGIGMYSTALGLLGNQVTGDDLDETAQDPAYDSNGFLASLSPCLWCCNEVTKVYNGIRIDGNCKFNDQLFGGNIFHEGLTNGLRLGTVGILGKQTHRSNRWPDAANTWQAWNEGGMSNASNSYFYVLNGSPYEPYPVDPISGWFIPEDGHEPDCAENCRSDKDPREMSELDERVASNEFSMPAHEAGTRWSLYRRLNDEPELVAPGTVFESFMAARAIGPVGQLTAVEQGIETAYALTPEQQEAWKSALIQQQQLRESIVLRDSLLYLADENLTMTLLEEKAALLQQYDAISSTLTTWWSEQLVRRDQQLAQLTEQNNAILTQGNVQADNEQVVNRALLSKVLPNNPLSSEDIEVLTAVAAQCALDGGAAVYQARVILDWAQGSLQVWPESCGTELQGMEADRSKRVESKWVEGYRVYPNPAVGDLTVEIPKKADDVRMATLYNALGQPVIETMLPGSTNRLALQTLPAGIYWLSIREAGHLVYHQLVVKN